MIEEYIEEKGLFMRWIERFRLLSKENDNDFLKKGVIAYFCMQIMQINDQINIYTKQN